MLQHSVTFYQRHSCQIWYPNLPQTTGIGQNSDGGISDIQISGQSLIKENCHNSRTSDDIDIKIRPVTTLEKKNMATSKNWTITSCQQIVTSLFFLRIYGQYAAIQKLNSRRMVYKTSLTVTFYLTKPESRTKKIFNTALILLL